MKWKIARAKLQFSELIRMVYKEPQLIFNRETMVAAIIGPEEYREYLAMKEQSFRRSLASAFEELRSICADDSYELIVPARSDRENSFP
ncbi:MAG TPA: prevent-host-death protein [Spirochaetota bacterium]|nr:prevent-host-death protein [Spirochaetota bacterium]HNT12882.1 prevent-host-death protein [Spirochaetota bacterium]